MDLDPVTIVSMLNIQCLLWMEDDDGNLMEVDNRCRLLYILTIGLMLDFAICFASIGN